MFLLNDVYLRSRLRGHPVRVSLPAARCSRQIRPPMIPACPFPCHAPPCPAQPAQPRTCMAITSSMSPKNGYRLLIGYNPRGLNSFTLKLKRPFEWHAGASRWCPPGAAPARRGGAHGSTPRSGGCRGGGGAGSRGLNNGRCVFGKIREVGLRRGAYFIGEIDRKRPNHIANTFFNQSNRS